MAYTKCSVSIYISTLDIIVKVDTSRYLLTMLHWPGSDQNIKKKSQNLSAYLLHFKPSLGGKFKLVRPSCTFMDRFQISVPEDCLQKNPCHFCQDMHFLGRKWHFLWKVYFIQKWSVAQNTVFQGVKYNLNINVVVSLSSNWSCAAAGPLSIVCLLCCAAHAA